MSADKKTILLVEDELQQMKVLSKKLIAEGYEVLHASNGEEAVNIALQDHPDLILLDIIMPVKDGLTALKELREDEWGKDAEVIILSNLAVAEKKEEALKQGAGDYLVKSDWTLDDIVVKVRDRLA
ncbi:MAG: response regulator [Patescibacteria group bacterium]